MSMERFFTNVRTAFTGVREAAVAESDGKDSGAEGEAHILSMEERMSTLLRACAELPEDLPPRDAKKAAGQVLLFAALHRVQSLVEKLESGRVFAFPIDHDWLCGQRRIAAEMFESRSGAAPWTPASPPTTPVRGSALAGVGHKRRLKTPGAPARPTFRCDRTTAGSRRRVDMRAFPDPADPAVQRAHEVLLHNVRETVSANRKAQ